MCVFICKKESRSEIQARSCFSYALSQVHFFCCRIDDICYMDMGVRVKYKYVSNVGIVIFSS